MGTIPKVEEGIILARMEWWCNYPNPITEDWREPNNGRKDESRYLRQKQFLPFMKHHPMSDIMSSSFDGKDQDQSRRLKPTMEQLIPADLEMDYAINGEIKTMKREEWVSHAAEIVHNCAIWPLL